jgi:bifunctional non-homologous end joining protein LigD
MRKNKTLKPRFDSIKSGNTLGAYRGKRDFARTREPPGKRQRSDASPTETHLFVVQKHAARRLHYDLRLELDGVLKSWAVTKGPSLVPGEKRLAVAVEDHPLDYADFEGAIPKGQYGGGTVIVWDKGSWRPLHDPAKGLAKGHLDFELDGGKLKGRWHLVRMAGQAKEKHENWLLIKGDDEASRSGEEADILAERPESAKTGRTLEEVAEGSPAPADRQMSPSEIKGAKKAAAPRFVEPELAVLAAAPPVGDKWIHEIKFDGYRLQARKEADKVTLLTRSGLDWTDRFGDEITDALRALPVERAVFDGELVVESANGASDFSALQSDLGEGRGDRFRFYLFDLLFCDGYDLRAAALIDRKALLEKILAGQQAPLRMSEHFEESGALVFRHVCRLSLEGVVSKLRNSPYRSGRGKHWLKSKCIDRQEFVIGGFAPSTISSKAIGSLALGFYEGAELKYAGRVGTGFSAAVAQSLFQKLEPLEIATTPFAQKLTSEDSRQLRPVKPELIAEVEFRAWTADGRLRHASFRGLREDKPASEVQREDKPGNDSSSEPKRRIKLTHADRLYWPDAGVTKEGLADYYAEVWRHAAPFIVGRPLALLRCPTGYTGEQFFQKHPWKGASPALAALRDPREPESLIGVNDLDGFLALAQGAALEIHPWGSRADDLERPDIIVMDLDPGEGVGWDRMIAAAFEVRDRLQRAGLAAFVKTSGGKGLHVAAPLKPKAEWPEVKAFCKAMAETMAADSPDRYIATIAKKSRAGRIFVDYLRNQRGATAVAPYSPRARAGAPVSAPIDWSELNGSIGSAHFTILNTPARLAALDAIPWTEFYAQAAPLNGSTPRARKRKLT